MQCRILTTDEDFKLYTSFGNKEYSVDIPYQYFHNGRILGFFKDGNLVGGAAIITKAPFRAIDAIPLDNRKESGIDSIPHNQIVELNAIWLSPDIKSITDVVFKFWYVIISEVRKTKRSWVIIPYNQAIGGLDRLYRNTGMQILYRGDVSFSNSHKRVVIGICAVSGLYRCFAMQAVKRLIKTTFFKKPARGSRVQQSLQTAEERG